MEDGLVRFTPGETIHLTGVLILVVMEDGLVQMVDGFHYVTLLS